MPSKLNGFEKNSSSREVIWSTFNSLFLMCNTVFRLTLLCSDEGALPFPPHFSQLEIWSMMFKEHEAICNFASSSCSPFHCLCACISLTALLHSPVVFIWLIPTRLSKPSSQITFFKKLLCFSLSFLCASQLSCTSLYHNIYDNLL